MSHQYIKEYTKPTPAEALQLFYKRALKHDFPQWDDTLVRITDLTEKIIPSQARVLDVGCGHGNWIVDELKPKIATAIGVDVDKDAVTHNKSMDKVIVAKDLESAHLKVASFDLATAVWVLEHVEDPQTLFAQLSTFLQPQGHFVFVTPYKHSMLIVIRRIFNLFARELGTLLVSLVYGRASEDIFPTYYRANDKKTISELAEKNGFEVVILDTNFCPSYTSFNNFTYILNKLMYRSGIPFFHPHLIGILRLKKS